MKITKAIGNALRKAAQYLSPLYAPTGWHVVHESFPGAWQQNVTINAATVTENWAVFGCVTLIAGDISKMAPRVMQYDSAQRIWAPTDPPLQPVLRKPNRYQTRIEFIHSWILSQLLNGNTYALKQRNKSGAVEALYILDPHRVTPLVASDGGVYYELQIDNLAQVTERIVIPQSEIIHDRMYTLWHPLIGVSPIYACGFAALQGSAIVGNSTKFFENLSRPGGVLTAPGPISDEVAERLATKWRENYTGANAGRVAILADGLKYEAQTVSATDSQLIEQLKFTGEMICAVFHVPPYKLGLGQMPTVNNVAALNQQYYDQALQFLIEKMELRLDEGLDLEPPFETWFDTTALLRMDPATRMDAHVKAISGALKAPNEARREEDLPPVEGGDTPYLQQQNYSLAALNKRDSREDPFGTSAPPAPEPGEDERDADFRAKSLAYLHQELAA